MRLTGMPLTLAAYSAEVTTNPQFAGRTPESLDRFYLPPSMTGLLDAPPLETVGFLEDDNRGAVSAEPVATLDGVEFHLSVKGVGSCVDPYASRPLDRDAAVHLCEDGAVRARFEHPRVPLPDGEADRLITGELWLRGSPYGGQGLEHASIAMNVAQRAELTSIAGFLIAPVVKVALLPPDLEERIRSVHWYRKYRGRMCQEIRLVPSNVRIYFHAKNTIGSDVRSVFEMFHLTSEAAALQFEVNFVRSVIPTLTLFARTLRRDETTGRYRGLEFLDVWLDKDAVLAPNGSVYFVDLEGIEEVAVDRENVREKVEDQVFRSLYEFVFAFEQIEAERLRRFGAARNRKAHFERVVTEALRSDPFVRTQAGPRGVELRIGNALGDETLNTAFPLVDA